MVIVAGPTFHQRIARRVIYDRVNGRTMDPVLISYLREKKDWIDIEDKNLQFYVQKFWFFVQVPKRLKFFIMVSEYSHTVSVSGIVPYILTA